MIRFKKEHYGIMKGSHQGLEMVDELDEKTRRIVRMQEGIYVKKPIPTYVVQVPVEFEVETKEGVMKGKPGDYLIQGIKGELYPCEREIFESSYKLVKMVPGDPGEQQDENIEQLREKTEQPGGAE